MVKIVEQRVAVLKKPVRVPPEIVEGDSEEVKALKSKMADVVNALNALSIPKMATFPPQTNSGYFGQPYFQLIKVELGLIAKLHNLGVKIPYVTEHHLKAALERAKKN